MKRFFIDCRDHPNDMNCSGAFFASSKQELLELVLHHRVIVHKSSDSPELRDNIYKDMKEAPPILRLHRL
jgi:hypothetical protein